MGSDSQEPRSGRIEIPNPSHPGIKVQGVLDRLNDALEKEGHGSKIFAAPKKIKEIQEEANRLFEEFFTTPKVDVQEFLANQTANGTEDEILQVIISIVNKRTESALGALLSTDTVGARH